MLDFRVSARALAEFSCLSGDLRPALQAAERMQEGMAAHKLRQAGYGEGYESESSLRITEVLGNVRLTVYGRADGLNRQCDPPVIEEIKTTRLEPSLIDPNDNPAHFAQGALYAYMLAAIEGFERVEVRLTYMHLSGESRVHARVLTFGELREKFLSCAEPYAAWLSELNQSREKMLPTLRSLKFPYEQYRDGQREMAAQGYLALKRHSALLAQAPTGIGKTAAVLFCALKAMGEGHIARIFYLTARTTARGAAERALDKMREGGLWVRAITLTAKEKLCPHREAACDPELCPLAQGYYDRRREALREALSIDRLTRPQVEALARKHELCPFEMQLDLSENCDVVICDYNYAFDPRVKLKRFFQDKFDGALLIDEAHNLIERARDMLSAELRLSQVRSFVSKLKKLAAPGDALLLRARDLMGALKSLKSDRESPGWGEDAPEFLVEKTEMFLDAARPLLGAAGPLNKSLAQLYFDSLNFTRVAGEMKGKHRALYEPGEREMRVRLWCYDPSAYLSRCLNRTRGAVLFSATLSPMTYYRDMLGLSEDEGDALIDLPSPFPQDNLCVVRLPIATTYKKREESAGQVARAIMALCGAYRGNYLACFPSYAYLEMVSGHIKALGAGSLDIITQRPGMTEAERDAFLSQFKEGRARTLLALTVMGGVFAEGIDLPGDKLSGAAIVGVGFPQISLERAALAQLSDEAGEPGDGLKNAYVYPGIERVLQAAGRVIRTGEDRGAVLLVDERYFQEGYEQLLPPHWQVQGAATCEQAARIFSKFWR